MGLTVRNNLPWVTPLSEAKLQCEFISAPLPGSQASHWAPELKLQTGDCAVGSTAALFHMHARSALMPLYGEIYKWRLREV